jgi:hypothetical protein
VGSQLSGKRDTARQDPIQRPSGGAQMERHSSFSCQLFALSSCLGLLGASLRRAERNEVTMPVTDPNSSPFLCTATTHDGTVEYDHVPTQARHFHDARSFSAATVSRTRSDEISWGAIPAFVNAVGHRSLQAPRTVLWDSGELKSGPPLQKYHIELNPGARARDRCRPNETQSSQRPSTSTAEPLLLPLRNGRRFAIDSEREAYDRGTFLWVRAFSAVRRPVTFLLFQSPPHTAGAPPPSGGNGPQRRFGRSFAFGAKVTRHGVPGSQVAAKAQ